METEKGQTDKKEIRSVDGQGEDCIYKTGAVGPTDHSLCLHLHFSVNRFISTNFLDSICMH